MKNRLLAVALSALGLAAGSNAQFAYAVDSVSNLHLVDLATGGDTLIGATGVSLMTGLSYDSGRLLGSDSVGNIYAVNPATGATVLLNASGLGTLAGMDHAGPNLFATDLLNPMNMYSVNQVTGATSPFVTSDTLTGSVRAMAFDPTFITVYIVADLPTFQTLYGMNSAGVTTLIGSLGNISPVLSIDVDMTTGVMWALDNAGNIGTINTTTGALTLTGNSTGPDRWTDMTMAPVPEPATMTALGLGALVLLRRRRKRS